MLTKRGLWACICDLKRRVFALENAEPPTQPALLTEPITSVFASGRTDGIARNCVITNTGTGQWSVTWLTAHPDGADYEILFGAIENGALRDVPKISVVEGSITANGFEVQVTVDDNGSAADPYSADNFSFAVLREIDVVVGYAE